MKFYMDSAATSGKYARAGSYGPFKSMPFIDAMSPEGRARRLKFWEINPMPPGMRIDPGYSAWPDCIRNVMGDPCTCFSGRVIEDLEQGGLPVWRTTEMPVGPIESKRLQNKPSPIYHVLEEEPGIDFDYEASGYPLDDEGNPIWHLRDPSQKGKSKCFSLSSWNGSHLMSVKSLGPMSLVWSEVAKTFCEEKGWTNFDFHEVPMVS